VTGGSGAIAAGTPVQMSWNFTLALGSIQGHTFINGWTVAYDLIDVTAGNTSLFSSQPTVTSAPLAIHDTTPVTFFGSQTFNLGSAIDPGNGHTLEQITVLTVNWTGQNNQQNNLLISFAPQGLNFNDSVPEPATLALCGAGLAGILWFGSRKRVKAPRL
jgi:hypothetical protein